MGVSNRIRNCSRQHQLISFSRNRSTVLSPVEEVISATVHLLHHGRRLMLDHLLVSAKLRTYLTYAESLNDNLPDEVDTAEQCAIGGSFHAPLLAEFALSLDRVPTRQADQSRAT